MELVVLGLGSNKNYISQEGKVFEPVQVLKNAINQLKNILTDVKVSSIWLSKAMYYENQEDFHNMCVAGYYEGSPVQLLKEINQIEYRWGRDREREIRNGPRSLDIDIELFGNLVIKTPNLTIPHEKITERAFVLQPLLEILPESAEPISGEKFYNILARLSPQEVRKISEVEHGRTSNDSKITD